MVFMYLSLKVKMNLIIAFMKRNYKALVLVGVFALALWGFMPKPEKFDGASDKDKLLLQLVTMVLENAHYHPQDIDDEFSKKLYKSFLEEIDANKRFFLQSDIEEFSKYELLLDDQIKGQDITFFNLVNTRFLERLEEAKGYTTEILQTPFNYSEEEYFNLDYEKQPYAKDKKELKEKWRKQLKLSVLSKIHTELQTQNGETTSDDEFGNEESEEIATPKKSKEPITIKTFEELEVEKRESELKTFNDFFSFMEDLTRTEWFSMYVNAITEQFDPHTNYMAPQDKKDFDAGLAGKFEGIGARLQKKGDVIEVSELISGGPAWREGVLEAGDLILKVAQEKEEPVDISGMRLDNVVKLIKGKKGTKVILTVKRVDGSILEIPITRDVVEMEESYVRSAIVDKDGEKFGVIYLPQFYFDINDNKSRDAAKDMALEIERLKKENIEGLIVDLRGNGGGSLRTAIDISGLFIEKGPVVQVKDGAGKIEVHQDRNSSVMWDGPLVIMVNNFSASASEIFAAAMQDYKRGIVVGSKHTYGKGTVQNFVDLNRFVRNTEDDFGAVKITIQKYYRIDGGSTQLEGVKSDVVLPDRYSYVDIGEKDQKNAMVWDKINSASYSPYNTGVNFDLLLANSRQRVAQNEQFNLIDRNAKWIDEQRNKYDYSLNYEKFKAAEEQTEKERKAFDAMKKYKSDLKFVSLPYEQEMMKNDSALAKKRERWHTNLSKDVYVEESLNILSDWSEIRNRTIVKTKN
jgi:carboxyl-terminal processing protease